jgi:hypothetical protein
VAELNPARKEIGRCLHLSIILELEPGTLFQGESRHLLVRFLCEKSDSCVKRYFLDDAKSSQKDARICVSCHSHKENHAIIERRSQKFEFSKDELEIPACKTCKGEAALVTHKIEKCSTCDGMGGITCLACYGKGHACAMSTTYLKNGGYVPHMHYSPCISCCGTTYSTLCGSCKGSKAVLKADVTERISPCAKCGGSGLVSEEELSKNPFV